MKENFIEFKNVDFFYKNKKILDDLSFSVKVNSFFVLLGSNGAGKSTIFSLITRLQNLLKGEIIINNYSIKDYSNAFRDVGIVFQESTLDLDLTVKQNLYYYGALKGLDFKETLISIEEELKELELQEFLDIQVRELNGGHRRKVEILRALINKPKILLFDEPTIGLDIKSKYTILNYLRKIVKTRYISVLWITHLFDEIEENDYLAIIKKGKIIEQGIVSDIIDKYQYKNLVNTFNNLVEDK